MGKTDTEAAIGSSQKDAGVKLDFGLSTAMLDPAIKAQWPYDFGLTYSVILSPGSLETTMHVTNQGQTAWEFQLLFHNYLRVSVRL